MAFDISTVYTDEAAFQKTEDNFLASAFTPASLGGENFKGLANATETYLGDVNLAEPRIMHEYDKMIPEIKRAQVRSSRPASGELA